MGLGKLVVIQNITCDPRDELKCSPSSLFYYAVDLNTRHSRVLTPPGLANNAVVNDSYLSNDSGSHVFLTRLTLGGEPFGKVKGACFVEIGEDNWQQHFNTGRGELEFVGDGRGGDVPTWGQPYIQMIKLSPQCNSATFEPLASNYGNMRYTDGARETNAKFIPFSGGLIMWSPFRTTSPIEEPGPRQVFATAYEWMVEVAWED